MTNLLTLKITGNKYIEIFVKNTVDSITYFDEIIVIYYKNKEHFVLFEDFACEGLRAFQNILLKALDGELQLEDSLKAKGIGYTWNNICNALTNSTGNLHDTISKYNVWSTTSRYSNETWMFNQGKEIYIEVSPTYKWFHHDMIEDEKYITYDRFMDNYKQIDLAYVDLNIAQKCLLELDIIIERMKV